MLVNGKPEELFVVCKLKTFYNVATAFLGTVNSLELCVLFVRERFLFSVTLYGVRKIDLPTIVRI